MPENVMEKAIKAGANQITKLLKENRELKKRIEYLEAEFEECQDNHSINSHL